MKDSRSFDSRGSDPPAVEIVGSETEFDLGSVNLNPPPPLEDERVGDVVLPSVLSEQRGTSINEGRAGRPSTGTLSREEAAGKQGILARIVVVGSTFGDLHCGGIIGGIKGGKICLSGACRIASHKTHRFKVRLDGFVKDKDKKKHFAWVEPTVNLSQCPTEVQVDIRSWSVSDQPIDALCTAFEDRIASVRGFAAEVPASVSWATSAPVHKTVKQLATSFRNVATPMKMNIHIKQEQEKVAREQAKLEQTLAGGINKNPSKTLSRKFKMVQ
ncbi:unknown protein [Seminavis robusta]|uniref:Uncharacterized protein n=1 Tax=Seminavis robusta TaxID=568900 RepID=A0A9N8EPL1_9STRA|nr:unknown protein [Seminavis robusta]|eukprot:Sro1382_g267930.1 n/a (272) ;mRNA; f:11685-12500